MGDTFLILFQVIVHIQSPLPQIWFYNFISTMPKIWKLGAKLGYFWSIFSFLAFLTKVQVWLIVVFDISHFAK